MTKSEVPLPLKSAGVFWRVNGCVTVVGSAATLLPVLISPPPVTVAMLVMLAAVLLATLTVSVMFGKFWPPLRMSLRVQEAVRRVQLHPEPVIEVGVRPAGRVSVTVTLPFVAAIPAFVTANV